MRRFFISLTLLLTLTGFRFTTISEAGTRGSSDPQLRIGNASIHISFNKGYRYERFYFFVNYDVYYSTYSDRYYWYDRGRWHSSRRLPSYLRHATRDRYIVINARHDRPWTYHADRWKYDSRYDRWDRRDDRRKDDRYDRYDDRRKDDRYDRKNDRRDDRRTDNDWDRNRDRDNNRKNDKQGRRN
jgi:hypothetical protein